MEQASVLLVFDSTNVALKTERLFKAAGIPSTVIPTPVEITADCGIALLLADSWLEAASEALDSSGSSGFRLVYPFTGDR